MKRLFIAIRMNPSVELITMTEFLKNCLREEKIKWVEKDNLHLTLAFLGDAEEKKIKDLTEILIESCSASKEFGLVFTGTGVFKNYSDPKVIWVGINHSEELAILNKNISERLKAKFFPSEEKRFRPHLTIGRVRRLTDPDKLKEALEKYKDVEFQNVIVTEVILYESILMKTGPIYKELRKFRLGEDNFYNFA